MADQFPIGMDIEPEELAPASAETSNETAAEGLALAALVRPILTFLPDVRLKKELAVRAEAAFAIDVKAEGGLVKADAALGPVRDQIKLIEDCFEHPTSLAFQLHRRLTGLKNDFLQQGQTTVTVVGQRIYDEKKRLAQLAEDDRRKRQEEANRLAREEADRAAAEAKKAGAPKEIVKEMKAAAKTTVAAPVAAVAPPKLANTITAANWKARLKGTPADDDNPQPDVVEMTKPQRESFLQLIKAVYEGRAPISMLDINWSVADARAVSDKLTFDIPGLEAFDAGQVRAKPRR